MMKYLLSCAALVAVVGTATPALAAGGGGDGHAPHMNLYEFHYGKNAQGGELQPGEEPMAPALFFIVFNFLIFAGVLVWKGGPAISRYLNNRHRDISKAIADATSLRDQAREKLDQVEAKLSRVDAEIETIVAEIRNTARAERDRIIEQAERQAAAMKADAESRIEADLGRARLKIEREVVTAAIAHAEKVLREQAGDADHQNLLQGFITELGNAPSKSQERPS